MLRTLADLFADEPSQWGLRGDPHLWRAMRAHFAEAALPASAIELERELEQAFLLLSGQPLSIASPFYVEQFAHGGLSSGAISPEFWRDRALALLKERYSTWLAS